MVQYLPVRNGSEEEDEDELQTLEHNLRRNINRTKINQRRWLIENTLVLLA